MDNNKFIAFLEMTKELNKKNITPVLMGSLGFEVVTNTSWDPRDIDVHVPGDIRGWDAPDDERIENWEDIYQVMITLGYELTNLHEHEFSKGELSIEFGVSTTLPEFAGVELAELPLVNKDGIYYYLPTLEQFLNIYQASSKDGYRNDRNNNKDFDKINYIKNILSK